jgi:hypothetical protein
MNEYSFRQQAGIAGFEKLKRLNSISCCDMSQFRVFFIKIVPCKFNVFWLCFQGVNQEFRKLNELREKSLVSMFCNHLKIK